MDKHAFESGALVTHHTNGGFELWGGQVSMGVWDSLDALYSSLRESGYTGQVVIEAVENATTRGRGHHSHTPSENQHSQDVRRIRDILHSEDKPVRRDRERG